MHYYIDMITHGRPLVNQSSALVETSFITFSKNSTFLKQADCTGLEPGWLTWQMETLCSTSMLLTCSPSTFDWCNKGSAVCNHAFMINSLKAALICVTRVGSVEAVGFRLSLYRLHVLNRNLNMIKSTNQCGEECTERSANTSNMFLLWCPIHPLSFWYIHSTRCWPSLTDHIRDLSNKILRHIIILHLK